MGSSFVEFRGRGFWSKDGPLQAAMYLLHRELADRAELSAWFQHWREKLIIQAVWAGSGVVWCGLQDYPPDQPTEVLAEIVRGAQARQAVDLTEQTLAAVLSPLNSFDGISNA